ncbi:MAG TPA: TetR/AcrR family transcriptional regulator [bacterium]|nr:TetR/AcrR family transcriptional regulator [bacterium]
MIQGAFNLFLERGYHGNSMRQIAQEVNIALGGIYNHFSAKDENFLRFRRFTTHTMIYCQS